MRAAGIRRFGGDVEVLDLPDPRDPGSGEVLISVRAAGVGNWDEFVRTGGWDTGARPPMALGVEAAGLVTAIGPGVRDVRVGAAVTTHSVPFPEQGGWAEALIARAAHVAVVPAGVPLETAAALPVPALTADQALVGAGLVGGSQGLAEAGLVGGSQVGEGLVVLVHGAGGVTGGMVVRLAAHRGARVIATAGSGSADRVRALGATDVLDYHDPGWAGRVRALTGGVDAAVNAARDGAASALATVRDGGRLVTITGDPPPEARGITVTAVQVIPDGPRLGRLVGLLAAGNLTLEVGARYRLEDAAAALLAARGGTGGTALVIQPG
jgi:NADPH:quinone reductase-like Zn-dependent oxidoreductase